MVRLRDARGRSDCDDYVSVLRASLDGDNANGSLCHFPRVRRLRCRFEAEAWRLLRLLLVMATGGVLSCRILRSVRADDDSDGPTFDIDERGADNREMRSWQRGVLAALMVVAFCGSTWAACAEGAIASPTEQMACCRAGHDHCPMKDSASDCCRKSGTQVEAKATIVAAVSVSAPLAVPVVWATPPAEPSTAPISSHGSHDSSPPARLYAPPPYIAFSGLLI